MEGKALRKAVCVAEKWRERERARRTVVCAHIQTRARTHAHTHITQMCPCVFACVLVRECGHGRRTPDGKLRKSGGRKGTGFRLRKTRKIAETYHLLSKNKKKNKSISTIKHRKTTTKVKKSITHLHTYILSEQQNVYTEKALFV